MVGLEENRVYDIGQIETLRRTATELLDTGIASCITWDMTAEELSSILAGTPIKCAELSRALASVSGKLNRPEYETDRFKVNGILCNVTARIPQQDMEGSRVLEPLTDNLQLLMGMTEDLEGCIKAAGTSLMLAEFQQKIDGVKQEWDNTVLEDNLAMFETILIGMPRDVSYAADPVNMSTGNFIYGYTDLSIKGERPLMFKRTYNAMSRRKGILGRGWVHNWEKRLEEKDGKLVLYHEDGREEHFFAQENGDEEEILPIRAYRSKGSLESLILKNENGNTLLTRNGQPAEYYDEAGRLILCEEGSGIKTALKYEGDRLTKIRRNTGEEICLFYDEKGHLAEVKDHTGRKISLSYSGKKLVSVTDPEGHAFRYEYGANGRISRMYDKRNVCILENEYDDYRRITLQRFPDGGVIRFDYQDKKKSIQITEQNTNTVTYIHDKQFREKRIISANGCEEWEYDTDGHVSRKRNKSGKATGYAYNKDGRLTEETDALGGKTIRAYDENGRLLSVTHPDNTKDVLGYDTYGRLTNVTDREGEKVSLSYMEADNRPYKITLADGSEMHLCYDERGNILSVDYPDGGCTSYEYDQLNRVTANRDGNGNITRFAYNSMDRITGIQRADGAVQKIEYNPMGEAVRIEDYDGLSMKWEYNVLNKPSVYEDKQGRKTFMEYDLMWNLSRLTDPEGAVTEYAYDRQNRLESVTDPLGRTVRFTYDADGNRTGICYPDGTKSSYEYDVLNRVTSETDRAGRVTRKEYDCMGNLVSVSDNAGEKTCYTHDKCGRKITETDRTGAVTQYTYTSLGKKESVVHPGGRTERWQYGLGGRLDRYEKGDGTWEVYGYDKNGNLTSKSYQDGNEHTYRYDCLNRMTDILLNGKKEKSYTYDAMGNMTSMEDASGRVTRYAYSPSGKLLSVTDVLGNKVFYAYNGRDELTGILQLADGEELTFLMEEKEPHLDKDWQMIAEHNRKNHDLHLTLFTRDAAGQTVKVMDALGREDCYEYDIMGRVKKRTNQEGKETAWEYHPDGQVKAIFYPDGKKAAYGYDALARLQEVRDWLGDTAFAYDERGRLTKSTDHKGNVITYGWNPDGTKKSMVYPDGRQVSYAYDTAGHVSRIESGAFSLDYEYDAYGRLEECRRDNGILTKYQYDALGRLCGLSHEDKDGILEAFRCTYDENGNKGSVERTSRDSAYSFCHTYTYDRLDRLTAVYGGETLLKEYFYDGYRNRMEAGQICSYDVMNRLTAKGSEGYSYSPKGELTEIRNDETPEQSRSFAYDSNGFLTSLYQNGQLQQENFHNGLGCRTGSSLYAEKLSEVSYGIDYAEPFKRILTESHTDGIKRDYLWQDDTLLGIPQDGVHVLTDLFHTPVRTAGKGGRSDSIYRYDEDGMLSKCDGTYALSFGYTGYLKESMDGLYYTGSREYSSIDGRFHSKDQYQYMDYKNPATLNLYVYAWNNPLRYFDFDGHECIEEKDYITRSLEMIFLGNFSDEVTGLGVFGSVVLGLFGLDFPMDVRDLVADLTVNFDPGSKEWWCSIGLDLLAFVPVIGALKYADEAALLAKYADDVSAVAKYSDEANGILKNTPEIINEGNETLDELKKLQIDSQVETVKDIPKTVFEGGLDALSTPSSKVLRQNLIEAGVEVPNYPNAAHHIVAGNAPKAAEARAILQKYGVDINDAANGTFLPTVKDVAEGAYHPSLHTDSYYRKVTELLSSAKSQDDVLDILDDIAEQLQDGTFK